MMKQSVVVFTVVLMLAALTGAFQEATALEFSVSDDNPGSTLIAGSTYNGYFDINAQLSSISAITAATATFTFSDYDGYSYTGAAFDGWYGGNGSYYGNQHYYYSDPLETAHVDVVGQAASGSSSYSASTTYDGYSNYYNTYPYSCGFFSTCWYTDTYTTYYYSDYSGYNGPWQLAMNLNAAGLAALSTGTLNFSIDAPTGTFYFNDAQLDVTAEPVPEPTSFLLLGSGLAGLAAWRRRQKNSAV